MKLAVTGTPGTGKTSATEYLEDDYDVIHLNERIKDDESLWIEQDEERGGSLVADLDAIAAELGDWSGILESHLAHYFDADDVVVLRATPEQIETRLVDRGETEATARENAESEALDVILTEAVEEHGEDHVYEIDTSELTPKEVAAEMERVIEGDREPTAGEVDFMGYL